MGILDRLRPQPPWQHPDPLVRAAAVQELPEADQAALASIAREDPDPRVRGLAAGRLLDAVVLAAVAGEDPDASVRDAAAGVLVKLACAGPDEGVAEAALVALRAERELAEVARSSEFERLSHLALDRLTDLKAASSVARRSRHALVRKAALERITAADQLADIAARSDERDVALAALDRLRQAWPEDRPRFETIAARARNKIVARRAKAILRMLDGQTNPPAPDNLQRQQSDICGMVEALMHQDDGPRVRAALADARARWAELDEGGEEDLARRFAEACAAVEARLCRQEREETERAARAQARADAVAARVALCAAVDALHGDEVAAKLVELRAAWAALEPIPDDEGQGDALARRFERAASACEQRAQRWRVEEARRARMAGLLQEAEQLLTADDLRSVKIRWAALRREWTALVTAAADPGAPADVELRSRFERLGERLRLREADERDARMREQQENYARLQHLCDTLEQQLKAEGLVLKDAERGLRDVRAALENPGLLPSRRDREQLATRLKAIQATLAPKVRELREIEDWQRWANLAVQEELCKRLEVLRESHDIPHLAKQLRETLAEWKTVRRAPKDDADELWRRFKEVYDELRGRCKEHFAHRAAVREGNLQLKIALCAQAESLAGSTDWVKTAQHFERLQAEWKRIGPAPREHAEAVWQRFRAACETFYTRRKADLAQRKQEWAKNLERKEALCAQAEAVAESTDWEFAAAEIRRLQAEWKAVGPVKKSRSEVVWQRFRTACDRFFERYRQREQLALEGAISAREAICRELEALAPSSDEASASPPDGLVARVQAARARWQETPPLPREYARSLEARFRDAIIRLIETYPGGVRGTELDPGALRKKMEKLCARVEALAPTDLLDEEKLSPGELLARKWRETLAAKQLGVKVDEEAKWRHAAEEVRQAQAAWKRLAPLPGETGRQLAERFHRACHRFFEVRDRQRRTPMQPSR